jgi:hypothetical protein
VLLAHVAEYCTGLGEAEKRRNRELRNALDDRYLCNWLAGRVDAYGQVLDGYQYEAKTILRLYAKAMSKGLKVVPQRYIPRPAGKRVGDTSSGSLSCVRCDVTYANSHFHCCVCHRVFRTAVSFENHQKIAEPGSDQALERLGLRRREDGVWTGEPMSDAARLRLHPQKGLRRVV